MAIRPSLSRRSFLAGTAVSATAAHGHVALAAPAAALPSDGARPFTGVTYRDPAPGAIAQPLDRILDHDSFINAFRFFTEAEIDDAANYRGKLDLTAAVQRALDGAWATNRDLFLPAGLYRVKGLTLPGGQAQRQQAFRFYGQGTGELFARREIGGTIVKGDPGVTVLRAVMAEFPSGNGNQEIAYIRFEGDSATPVLDLGTLYTQSELHHCGVFQAGTGDGVRIRHAGTSEIHHNYVINRDWLEVQGAGRVGTGIRLSVHVDNGLITLRKNTSRGFKTAYRLGGKDTGVLLSLRMEQCETSNSTNGIWLEENVQGAVIDQCYFEGGDGGTGIYNRGDSNTFINNYIFAGFAVAIDDDGASKATRIVYNTLSAGNARTVNKAGATLIQIQGTGPLKVVHGNHLVSDPVSYGPTANVVGIAVTGDAKAVSLMANAFEPALSWGPGAGSMQMSGDLAQDR